VFILVWCLNGDGTIAGLAAFYACSFLGFMLVTNAVDRMVPCETACRNGRARVFRSVQELGAGRRNMLACHCHGSGRHHRRHGEPHRHRQSLADIVEKLSFGSLMGVLLLTALFSLVLAWACRLRNYMSPPPCSRR